MQTILLADDDDMIVDALSYQLEKEGYKVLKAYDGEEALELARQGNPDLVLLDGKCVRPCAGKAPYPF